MLVKTGEEGRLRIGDPCGGRQPREKAGQAAGETAYLLSSGEVEGCSG
jgi:hypothetical protein